ncbi:MAG TPA: hypothetical protein VGR10_05835 [Thermoleophilaceae bacterium]|nr:hypothetical protein [Thermoleophilaceae bacterium]
MSRVPARRMLRVLATIALIVVGGLAGGVLGFAPAWLAIPVALVLALPLLRRQRSEEAPGDGRSDEPERNRLGAERQPFTARDRKTLTP